ncbi:MAG: molecular chaperone [Pseudomonas sp.]
MPLHTRFIPTSLLAAACLIGWVSTAHAALTVSSTRIVHESNKRSSSVVVANPSKQAYAAQAWVNTSDDDTTTQVPLIASPALFRLDPGKRQSVQINMLPNQLPQDRESVFYFNVQEIPQVSAVDKNVLNIALRTRIKLFYRPSQLTERPETQLKALKWSLQRKGGQTYLVVDNPSPYHYTFGRLEVSNQNQREVLDARAMAVPLGQQSYLLSTLRPADDLTVTFTAINDYGGHSEPLSEPLAGSMQ